MIWNYPRVTALTENLSGLYRIDHEPYHDGPGISSSDAKNALVSYGYFQHKKDADEEPTPAMEFGRAFHMAILEPDLFAATYRVAPKLDRRFKDQKAQWLDFEREVAEKKQEIITADNWELLHTVATNVRTHPKWDALKNLEPEIMACGADKESGMFVKSKADLFGSLLVDFKTTLCAAPWEFNRAVTRFGYHISAAFYQDVFLQFFGQKLPFLHVAVEKKPPYGVAFYSLSDEYLAEGRKLYRAALGRIAKWRSMPLEKRRLHYGETIQVLHPTSATLYKTKDMISACEVA